MRLILNGFWIAVALVGSIVTPAMADEWNKETRVEISGPLEIPGKILAAGKYVFKLLDSTDRHVVEVFSEDGRGKQTLVTTILAIPAYTLETPDKPVIRLEERPSNLPQAIHSWFYPGDNYGWQFVYPKSERLLTADAPAQPPAPIPASEPATPERPIEAAVPAAPVEPMVVEKTVIVSSEMLVLIPDETSDGQGDEDRTLPETAGHSATELAAGIAMLGLGLAAVLTGRRRAKA